ncbi:MAG: periplasmic heavy metal sensor [Thermodesulfobacteriota bacterium]|nr:periplasmic heavy metal sensor [Thermodesulfobacteriota bacterium]
MKIQSLTKTLIVLTLVAIMGVGVTAFAGKGKGNAGYAQSGQEYGQYGCDGSGYGKYHKGYGKRGFRGNLSEEEIAKLNEERNAFFQATEELRRNIYQKRLELNSELAKKNPDAKKAGALQKELSGLKGQLDQQRLQHRIRMNKISPDLGRMGPGFGHKGRGFHGGEMGRWQGSQGRCW